MKPMKAAERDQVAVDQVDAIHRVAEAVEAPERARRLQGLGAAFPPCRRLFGGERGAVALLRGIPGFAALWETVVPDARVREVQDRELQRWQIVRCRCDEHPALRPGAVAECPGGCGRWFFATGRSVRVHRFGPNYDVPTETEAAA